MGSQLVSSKSGPPTITLQYRASISQATGEDWKGVALTLSTASPLAGSEIPKLQPWTIGPPQLFRSAEPMMRTSAGNESESSTEVGDLMYYSRPRPFKSKEVVAKANEGAISSSFEVEGNSNIPSDGSSHKVSIVVSPA